MARYYAYMMCTCLADIAYNAFLGGDWSLQPDFCRAVIRATALEGELYVVKAGNEIVSTASWFGPDSYLFKTYVGVSSKRTNLYWRLNLDFQTRAKSLRLRWCFRKVIPGDQILEYSHSWCFYLHSPLYLLANDQINQYPEGTGKLDAALFTDEVNTW